MVKRKRTTWHEGDEVWARYTREPETQESLLRKLRQSRARYYRQRDGIERYGHMLSVEEWQDLLHHLTPRNPGRPHDPDAYWRRRKAAADAAEEARRIEAATGKKRGSKKAADAAIAAREGRTPDAIRKRRKMGK